MARQQHHHRRHRDDDDEILEDGWDKSDKVLRHRHRFAAYLPYMVFTLVLLAVIMTTVYFIFNPPSASERDKKSKQENTNSLADRATAFKILEFIESRRTTEAIMLAETIADKIQNMERDIPNFVMKKPDDFCRLLESYIYNWISFEYAAATQSTFGLQSGYPSDITPDAVVFFLCNFADYRARKFIPPVREINEEILGRIFLQAASEKYKRAEL